jgi:hypothetical protein
MSLFYIRHKIFNKEVLLSMLLWLQLNWGWLFALGGSIYALAKILLHLRDKIKNHDEKICVIDDTVKNNKQEVDKKIKILEDSLRCRDEVILNKLDVITKEMSEMNIKSAKLLGVLSGKDIIKSDDLNIG